METQSSSNSKRESSEKTQHHRKFGFAVLMARTDIVILKLLLIHRCFLSHWGKDITGSIFI